MRVTVAELPEYIRCAERLLSGVERKAELVGLLKDLAGGEK